MSENLSAGNPDKDREDSQLVTELNHRQPCFQCTRPGPCPRRTEAGTQTRPTGLLRTSTLRSSLADFCATPAPCETKDGTIRVREFPHRWAWSLHVWEAGAGEALRTSDSRHITQRTYSSAPIIFHAVLADSPSAALNSSFSCSMCTATQSHKWQASAMH
jgi:hypothetical protein